MNLLERAARAAAEQHGEDWDQLPERYDNQRGDLDRLYFYEQARAVIEAIREPSEGMVAQGLVALNMEVGSPDYTYVPREEHVTEVFGAMIDALLSESSSL